jgi:hypothetical protein
LAVAILGRYRYHLAGRWRAAYVISSVTAFYFSVFVLVAQLFQKVPALKDLAPTQSDLAASAGRPPGWGCGPAWASAVSARGADPPQVL